MSNVPLSDEEANKLFSQVSQAMDKDDSEKLSNLISQETPEEEEQPEEDTPADEPEDNEEEDTSDSDESKDEEDESADDEPADDKKKDDDPIAELRAQLEELKKQQHTASSQLGRVSSIQRRLSQYDKQLADLKNATSGQNVEKVSPEIDEALKDLDVTDPALAKTIRDVMSKATAASASQSNAQEIARIEALRDADYDAYVDEQRSTLLSKYPNAVEVFKSKGWTDWKAKQPKHVIDMATSDDALAVGEALERYRTDILREHPELAEKQEENKEEPKVNERAQQIEEERKRKQSSTANLDGGKPPARSKEPTDPEALFNKLFKEQLKEITGK